MLWPKKNSYKEFDNEKKFLPLENSPPPHNVSNGRSLSNSFLLFYSPQPRIQVWILKLSNSGYVTLP